jgi:hypothetical protein
MRFGTTRSQIYDAQKTARAHWMGTEADWNDEVRREHGEAVWEPLDMTVSDTLRAIDQLTVLFSQIRNECDYPGQL